MEHDLSQPPTDPAAARGYAELYRLWKHNSDELEAVAERGFSPGDFKELVKNIEAHLDRRESQFFNQPFEPHVLKVPAHIHAKTLARLHIILLDRRL